MARPKITFKFTAAHLNEMHDLFARYFYAQITSASWQPQVRDSDAAGIEAAAAHTAALAAFNPPPIAPSRIKQALTGFDTTASGDHRLGQFGAKV